MKKIYQRVNAENANARRAAELQTPYTGWV